MEQPQTVSPAAKALASIQERMVGVPEETVIAALLAADPKRSTTMTVGTARMFTFQVISEREARPVSALTRIA